MIDYLALRRHLEEPLEFLRLRKHSPPGTVHQVRLRGGAAIRLRGGTMDRHIFHRIFARDEYRLNGIPPNSLQTVIDAGAHIGIFSIRAARRAGRVISLEPEPGNHALLLQHTAPFPNVIPCCKALAGKGETASLQIFQDPSAHSLLPHPPGARGSISVDCLTLEDVFSQHGIERCDLLKIDCEGAEYEILYSIPRELWRRIDRIYLEYHPAGDGPDIWSGERLARHVSSAGYEVSLVPRRKARGSGHLFCRRRDLFAH